MTGQQLKNSILQWAIQGRLVPQDPSDEPASVLLQRIRDEKQALVKEGKPKKKDLEDTLINQDEITYEIPKNWEWCRIKDISESYIGLTYKPSDISESGTIVLRSSNIQNGKIDYNDIVRVNSRIPDKLWVEENDIIICARNGSKKLVGKSALVSNVKERMTFGAFMAICKTPFYKFVYTFLQSKLFFTQLQFVCGTTTINQLTQKNFNNFYIPLPPLAEQKRIVEKIEELMPFVEAYDKAQTQLDTLSRELPDKLKKSILQEAISGRLVPQDPSDEPASALLQRIRNEKQTLVRQGKLKKEKPLNPITDDEKPFEIPDSWEWVRWRGIGYFMSGQTPKSNELDYTIGGIPYFKVSDMNVQGNEKYMTKTSLFLKSGAKYKLFPKNAIIYPKNGGAVFTNKKRILSNDSLVDLNTGGYIPSSELFFDYIFYLFSIIDFKKHFKGTALPTVDMESIDKILVPLPPLAEQKRIVEKIEKLFKEIETLKA
ncbi:MAG: restriction endonuclease subunit S [Bacteroidaceae bacterium]|nr:restriction endonuclease subunit S [Bacteroidaceae bacterium]